MVVVCCLWGQGGVNIKALFRKIAAALPGMDSAEGAAPASKLEESINLEDTNKPKAPGEEAGDWGACGC